MTYKVLVAALAISIAASSAAAAGTTDQKSKGQASVGERKYCIKYGDMTGTRVKREECRTKKDWADEGVQIDEKKSN